MKSFNEGKKGNKMSRKLNFISKNLKINRLSASRDNSQGTSDIELNLLDIASLVWRNKKFIAAICLGLMVITATVMLMLPNQYTSTASILPSGEVDRYSAIKQLAGIGGMGGGTDENSSLLFPTILKSNQVIDVCLEQSFVYNSDGATTTLMDYYGTTDKNMARGKLREELSVNANKKTGVITLGLETEYPLLSQNVLSGFIDGLENYNLNKRKSSASENVAYLEHELTSRKDELADAEDALESFQNVNRNWYNTTDPTLVKELARLKREVELKLTTYSFLAEQYEIAKLDAQKTTPIVRMLDEPNLPTKKSSPKRLASVLLAGIVGFFLTAFWIILSDAFYRYKRKAVSEPMPVVNRTRTMMKSEV